MPSPRLNVDIFANISEFLADVPDVLSFSLTCSSLRPVATKRLLSMRPISLTEDKSVQKFHSFLFADAVARAPRVRALSIRIQPPQANQVTDQEHIASASPLVEIIASCPRLTHLSISLDKDFVNDQPIVVAISALQSLRSLTVIGRSTDPFLLLQNLSFPLRRLSVRVVHSVDPTTLEGFLPRLSQTLEELELLYFQFSLRYTANSFAELAPNFFRDHTQYLAVRSLTIIRFEGTPLLDHLQHLFPALDGTLYIRSDSPINSPRREAIHAANLRAQDGSLSPAWKKLDRIVCSPGMLHILALRCPVRHVMLEQEHHDGCCDHEKRLPYAIEALRVNPVPRLKLTLECGRGMFDGIFTQELAGTLTHLTLFLVHNSFYVRDGSAQPLWDFLLGAVLSALQPLHNLTHLRIVIHCKLYRSLKPRLHDADYWRERTGIDCRPDSWDEVADTVRGPDYSENFMDAIRGPAFDGAAASLARALPSAKYVFLMTGGNIVVRDLVARTWRSSERWNVSRGWRVANAQHHGSGTHPNGGQAGDPPALVELHRDVVDTIIQNEELILSEMDESLLFPKDDRA